MGNRVAKSNINYIGYNASLRLYDLFVKVQRVYGSSCIVVSIIITLGQGFAQIIIQYIKTYNSLYIERWVQVRYTLMVQEIGYPIKILSKFLTFKSFATIHTINSIDPMFVTGLVDGEGSFVIKVSNTKSGWRTRLEFCIGMHITFFKYKKEEIKNY